MGVLDDAIREHLELKRKHGAPEREVRQKEQEVLGPPGRQPAEQSAEPVHEADSAPVEEAPAESVAADPVVDEPTVVESIADPMETDLEPPTASEPPPRDDELLHDPIDEAFAEPAAEEPRGSTPPRGFETVEDAPLPAQDTGEHDVLEETPDFLEETPEHDRHWFEQRPPRDFNFDD